MVEFGTSKKASSGLGFADVVGQAEFKEALLAVAANEALDGLLVRGEKGTAKSTTVRALADLLPTQRAVAECPYGCPPDDPEAQCTDCRERENQAAEQRPVPLVTLPLGATRERVVGTLSVADALAGEYEFDPGLLARANRGILYVDEVNLLDDHLVDVLLDAAASGVNRVERDGVSVAHPASFTLVGTMNPEEGDLRPQLRDRFALQATVTGSPEVDERVAIIDRALGRAAADGNDDAVRERLLTARDRLAAVELPAEFTAEIAELCRDAGVEGHRADIATARAARTFAALDDRPKVLESDVRRAAELALPHRLRSRPFDDAPDASDVVDDHFDEGGERGDDEAGDAEADEGERPDGDGESGAEDDETAGDGPERDESPEAEDGADEGAENAPEPAPAAGGSDEERGDEGDTPDGGEEADADESEDATPLVPGQSRAGVGDAGAPELAPETAVEEATGGARARARPSADSEGARVRTEPADGSGPVDAAASVRAAATRGSDRVGTRDLRRSVRAGESSALVLFAVDASASMRPAMRTAKGTVLELLEDAYRQRDEVGFVAFAGEDAEVLLPPTDSVTRAARHLKDLPTGDRTPLPAGLRAAADVVARADPAAAVVVVVTDGRANVADGSPTAETRAAAERLATLGAHVVVVDAGDEDRAAVTDAIVEPTGGERVPLAALSAERVDAAVGDAR